jgi:hypothetical protein
VDDGLGVSNAKEVEAGTTGAAGVEDDGISEGSERRCEEERAGIVPRFLDEKRPLPRLLFGDSIAAVL